MNDIYFQQLYNRCGSIRKVATHLGLSPKQAYTLLKKKGVKMRPLLGGRGNGLSVVALTGTESMRRYRSGLSHVTTEQIDYYKNIRIQYLIREGWVLVGSDAHIWPGVDSMARRAFIAFSQGKMFGLGEPDITVLNGDVFDGARISRFPSIGWEHKPDVAEELEACKDIVTQLGGRKKAWPLGNHDFRFETYIANHAPEMKSVEGVHLKDHFPEWEPCWSLRINDDVGVKHRFKHGPYATRNNALYAGITMVTGHLHALNVTRFSDYNGPRWGVDGGTLAAFDQAPQFVHYTEDNPLDWASGFVVLTWEKGRLLWPEVVHVIDEAAGLCSFRGKVFEV